MMNMEKKSHIVYQKDLFHLASLTVILRWNLTTLAMGHPSALSLSQMLDLLRGIWWFPPDRNIKGGEPFPLCPRYTLLHKICHLVIAFSAFGHPCKGHQDRLIHGAFNPQPGGAETVPGWLEKLVGCFTHQLEPTSNENPQKIAVILVLELNFPTKSCWLWWFCLNASVKKKSEVFSVKNDIVQGPPIERWLHPQISNNCQLTSTPSCQQQVNTTHKRIRQNLDPTVIPISDPHQAIHSENVLIIKAQRSKNVGSSGGLVFLLDVIETVEFMEGAPKKDGMETVGVIQFFQCHNFSNQVGCYIQWILMYPVGIHPVDQLPCDLLVILLP